MIELKARIASSDTTNTIRPGQKLSTRAYLLQQRIEASARTVAALTDQLPAIDALCGTVLQTLSAGGTIYTAGNGGSAAQALHLAEEFIGRYRSERPPQPAICLCADSTALTCIANDYGFDEVFARQLSALFTRRDTLVVLSTSGKSTNLVAALKVARTAGGTTIGLLGDTGGNCLSLCNIAIVVPGADPAHIQEAHQVLIHLMCEVVEPAD